MVKYTLDFFLKDTEYHDQYLPFPHLVLFKKEYKDLRVYHVFSFNSQYYFLLSLFGCQHQIAWKERNDISMRK